MTSDLCLVTMEDHLPGLAEGERVGGANHTAIHQNTLSLKRTDQDWLTNKWQVLQNHLYNTDHLYNTLVTAKIRYTQGQSVY